MHAHWEFDLFFPLYKNDGTPTSVEHLERMKKTLAEKFGGLTHFQSKSEGLFRIGNVLFRDEITILRVLASPDASTEAFFSALKHELEKKLEQEEILILRRPVEVF